jgi:hypothetical protein
MRTIRMPVTMPARWVRLRGGYVAPGVHGSGVAPRLEHRCEPFDGGLAGWHRAVAQADAALRDLDVDEEDEFDLAGHETVYRRFCHTTRAGVPVVSEQWLWVVGGTAHLLLATVATDDYADYCEVFESVAETFDPAVGDPGGRGRPRSA